MYFEGHEENLCKQVDEGTYTLRSRNMKAGSLGSAMHNTGHHTLVAFTHDILGAGL